MTTRIVAGVLAGATLALLGILVEGAHAAESRSPSVPNGLEFGAVQAVSLQDTAGVRRVRFTFSLKNVGKVPVTVLTQRLQSEYWDYKEPPRELHIGISAFAIRDGEALIPPLDHFSPVILQPGESKELDHEYVDRKGIKEVVLVYDMLNRVSEKYGTWRGRIHSPVVRIEAGRR